MERDGQTIAELLKVGSVCLVMNIVHSDVQGLDGEVGDIDLGTAGEELQQAERVFATRQTDEDFVVLVDELVLPQRFIECFPKSFFQSHLLIHKYQINGTDDKEECQDVVPVQVGALEHDVGNDAEYGQRDALLDDLQLNEVEGAAILDEADTVGRNLTAVLQKGDAPREYDDAKERPVAAGS